MNKLYNILGLSEKSASSQDAIKKAYRKLAKKYHPDVNSEKSAEEKFKEINFAYEILSDKKKKAEYDRFGDKMFENGNSSSQHQSHAFNMEDIIEKMFNGGTSFRGGFNPFGQYSEPDIDIHAEVEIPITMAMEGGSLPLQTNLGNFVIKIKKNIKENDKIKVKGKGRKFNGKQGDLYLIVTIVGDENWKVNEIDLYKNITIPLKTAIFGGEIEINYFNNQKFKVKIPENVEYGQKIRVKGKGFYDKRFKEPGDLYLIVNIELPKVNTLSTSVKKILKSDLTEEVKKDQNIFNKMKGLFN